MSPVGNPAIQPFSRTRNGGSDTLRNHPFRSLPRAMSGTRARLPSDGFIYVCHSRHVFYVRLVARSHPALFFVEQDWDGWERTSYCLIRAIRWHYGMRYIYIIALVRITYTDSERCAA